MPVRRKCESKPPTWTPPESGEEIELKIKVITPMFGGGFEARNVDDVIPIRAAAIRGHLRFWWRATAGAKYATAEELFRAEAELWGSAAHEVERDGGKVTLGAGKVAIAVRDVRPGTKVSAKELIPKATPQTGPQEGVFLFPFAEQNQVPFAEAREDVQFELQIDVGDSRFGDDVKQALIAWLLFGGVGARTRRGCGALHATNPPDWMPEDFDALQKWLKSIAIATHRTWPMLGGGFAVVGPRTDDARAAWRKLGEFWSAVRKGHIGNIDYSPMSGGKWADHKTLRDVLPSTDAVSLVKPFLGMPIVYQQFPGAFSGTVNPDVSTRFASPVILKPLVLSNGGIYPLVLVLQGPSPEGVRLGERRLALTVPTDDPVLGKLNHPLVAVLSAAKRYFQMPEHLKIGGGS